MASKQETHAVWLPLAPSVNSAYTTIQTGRGCKRVSSHAKRAWEGQAWRALKKVIQQPDGAVKPPYRVTWDMEVYLYQWRRDISNVVKLTEDLLAEYFGFDDRYVVRFSVTRVESATKRGEGIFVTLTISPP